MTATCEPHLKMEQVKLVTFDRQIDVSPLVELFETNGSSVAIEVHENRMMASWEWLAPAALVILISKPFFDNFVGEFGSVAGKAALEALKKQVSKIKTRNPRRLTSHDSKEYLRLEEQQAGDSELAKIGKPVALLEFRVIETSERSIRLVIPHDTDDSGIDDALMSLSEIFTEKSAKKLELVYEMKTRRWKDMRQLIAEKLSASDRK